MKYEDNIEFARKCDSEDPLRAFRDEFHLPIHKTGKPVVYLCGNSLGLQPKAAAQHVSEELATWRELVVEGHFKGLRPWAHYHDNLGQYTANIVGAKPDEVINMNTLTVNLHLMMVSFYRPTPERHKILMERPAFPSDRYAVHSQICFHGLNPDDSLLEVGPRPGENDIREEDLASVIEREGGSIALILLPGVQYYSGQVFEMGRITELGHARGCTVGFDLAHAVGNIPLALHDWDVDFAIWCTYKYLNSGPGAVAGCFVHERYARDQERPRFAGWWGHDGETRFQMGPDFKPIAGAPGWQLSNPPVLSLAPLISALEMFDRAGMQPLREKSVALTGYLDYLLTERLHDRIEILTPREPERRGCQLSLRAKRAHTRKELFARLVEQGVICDWREPDIIRIAPAPIYNNYEDVFRFVEILDTLSQQ